MNEAYVPGVKANAAVRIGTGRPVFEVTFDRAAQMAQLAAYLMVTAGEQLHFQKMVLVSASDVLVIQLCQFRVRPSCGDNV